MAGPYVASGYVTAGYASLGDDRYVAPGYAAAGYVDDPNPLLGDYVAPGYVATGYVSGEVASFLTQNALLPLPAQDVEVYTDNPLEATIYHNAVLPLPVQSAHLAISRIVRQAVTLALPFQNARVLREAPPPLPPATPIEEPLPVRVTGDAEDMMARLIAVLPPWWGPPGIIPPVLRLPLRMAADVGAWLHQAIAYARLQTRIATATGGWLDLIAFDFFGNRVRRRAQQPDESFRKRILAEMFRPRATRPAMVAALRDLTGREPRIFEPSRPQDTGGIGMPGLAIGMSGAIGALNLPGQVFIDVYRSPDAGIPYASGIGVPAGGIGTPSRLVIANLDQVRGALTDADVYATVEATRPAGIIAWVRLNT